MPKAEPEIWCPISWSQAERVLRQMVEGNRPGSSLIKILLALGGLHEVTLSDLQRDPEFQSGDISQNVLISLLVLSAFHGDVERRGKELALKLHMSPSTIHRYLKTWVSVGVLEQVTSKGSYRIARRWVNEISTSTPPLTVLPTGI